MNIISQLDKIRDDIRIIHRNFTKTGVLKRTQKLVTKKLSELDSLHTAYKKLEQEIDVENNINEREALNSVRKTYYTTYNNISGYLQTESSLSHLKDVLLQHLEETLETEEFEKLENICLNESIVGQTEEENFFILLESVLNYYTKEKTILVDENEQLRQHITSLKKLNNVIQTGSENHDTEIFELEEKLKLIENQKQKLQEKIRALESQETSPDISQNQEESSAALIELLEANQELYKKELNRLKVENQELKNQINYLQQQIIKKAKTVYNMSNPLQEISKQVNGVIPIFTGEKSRHFITELNVFLDTCRMVHDSLDENGQKIFLQYITTRCRGDAYDLVTRREFKKFSEFTQILKDAYLPIKSVRDFKEELHRCTQRPGETLTEFGDRLRRVLWDCIRCIEGKYKENTSAFVTEIEIEAIDVFRAGIDNQSVRHYLLTIKSEKLESIIKEAIYFENVDNRYKKKNETETHAMAIIENDPHYQEQWIGFARQNQPHPINRNNYQFNQQQTAPSQWYPPQPFVNQKRFISQPRSGSNRIQEHNRPQDVYPPNNTQHQNLNTKILSNMQPINIPNYNYQPNMPTAERQTYMYQPNSGGIGFQGGQTPNRVRCEYCGLNGHNSNECRRRRHVCNKCGQTGHFVLDCTSLPSTNNLQPISSCLFCGRINHSILECEFKKKWEDTSKTSNQNQGN